MATAHFSKPKSFAGGDNREWFQKFEICSKANSWDTAKKAKKLPTLLEGEALAAWMELTNEEKNYYGVTKGKLIKKMVPLEFVSLKEFQKQSIIPGESVSMYLYEWEIFISVKLFKFFVSSTTHLRKLEARANHKFQFYEMWPKFWWCTLYSNPMEEVSYVSQL